MLPARVLTIGGLSGPSSRLDVAAVVAAFKAIYGTDPRVLTVMPEALDRVGQWACYRGQKNFAELVFAGSRPESPDPVRFGDLTLTVGPCYQLTD